MGMTGLLIQVTLLLVGISMMLPAEYNVGSSMIGVFEYLLCPGIGCGVITGVGSLKLVGLTIIVLDLFTLVIALQTDSLF